MTHRVFFILIASILASPLFSTESQRTLFFEQIEKGTATAFTNRLADLEYEYVLSPLSHPEAIQSIEVTSSKSATLYIGELKQGAQAPQHAQCFQRICVLQTPFLKHKHDNHFHYLEPQADEVIHQTPPLETLSIIKAEQPKPTKSLPDLEHYSPEKLKELLSEFSGSLPTQVDGQNVTIEERATPEGRSLAKKYLQKKYEELGYQVSLKPFNGRRGQKGENLIAERPGADPSKVFIVSSHIDSARNPGADDDGAGTITALAIAAALKDLPLKYTLRFIAFDLEEVGIIGAHAYTRQLVEAGEIENVVADFHLEMTGYDGDQDGAYHIVSCREDRDGFLKEAVLSTVNQARIPIQYVPACTSASDHSAFWRRGRPAIVISENFFGNDGNPCYHRACDKVNLLDFEYMEHLTRASALTVARLVSQE